MEEEEKEESRNREYSRIQQRGSNEDVWPAATRGRSGGDTRNEDLVLRRLFGRSLLLTAEKRGESTKKESNCNAVVGLHESALWGWNFENRPSHPGVIAYSIHASNCRLWSQIQGRGERVPTESQECCKSYF